MMPLKRALVCAKQQYPDLKPTGNGYTYESNYFLELVPDDYNPDKDGLISDSYFKVDGLRGTVTPYNPVIDGLPDLNKIEFL